MAARFEEEEVSRLAGVVRDAQSGFTFAERWTAIDAALRRVVPCDSLTSAAFRRSAFDLPQGDRGLIRLRDDEALSIGREYSRNYGVAAMDAYRMHYAALDPTAAVAIRSGGVARTDADLLPTGAWGRDAFTGEHLPRMRIRHLIFAIPPISTSIGLSFGVYRERAGFDERERAALQLIVPHLVEATRAVLADERLAGTRAPRDAGQGTLLLSARGEVEHADGAARALLGRIAGSRSPLAPVLAAARRMLRERELEGRQTAPLRDGGRLELAFLRAPSLGGRIAVFLRALETGTQPFFDAAADAASLSPREREVAALAARGLANKEIARALGIALDTAKEHLSAAYRKTGADGRAALTAYLLGGGAATWA